jgi:hypothetical protein
VRVRGFLSDVRDAVARQGKYAPPAAKRLRAERDRYRNALECIISDRGTCENFTGQHTCRDPLSGRTRGAYYGAEAWCDVCIARDALGWNP